MINAAEAAIQSKNNLETIYAVEIALIKKSIERAITDKIDIGKRSISFKWPDYLDIPISNWILGHNYKMKFDQIYTGLRYNEMYYTISW